MRIRTIKPSFFKDEEIAELDPIVRLLYQGLWLMADSAGRLEDRPKRIKVEVLPYDDIDVNAALEVLHSKRFILRYQAGDRRYIQVRTFCRHQLLTGKEKDTKSTIPAPEQVENKQEQYRNSTGTVPEQYRNSTDTDPDRQEGKGRERKGESSAREENFEPERTADSDPLTLHTWQKFLAVMPMRNGKHIGLDQAFRFFRRDPAKWPQWLAAVQNYAASAEVRDGAACSPLRFLREKWVDWLQPETPSPSGPAPPQHTPDTAQAACFDEWEREAREHDAAVAAGAASEERPRPAWQTTTAL